MKHDILIPTRKMRTKKVAGFCFQLLFLLAALLCTTRFSNAATYSLSANTASVKPGENVRVDWTVSGGGAKDWISWFRVGDPNSAYDRSRWQYTGGSSSGSFTIAAPTLAGAYEFRYLFNDGFNETARSQSVAIVTHTLVVSSVSVQVGQNISTNWTAQGGSSNDWIGWFKVGDPNNVFDPTRWRYTNSANSGTFATTAPTTGGTYEFRYLTNGGFTSLVASPTITVSTGTVTVPPTSNYALDATTPSIKAGQANSVNWTSPSGGGKDWISLYKVGDPNNAYDRDRWRYTSGVGAGTFATTAPSTPGNYEFRYLTNDSFTSMARSQPINVTSTTAPNPPTSTYFLTSSASSATPSQSISVNWTSPGGIGNDWIAFVKVGDPNSAYDTSRWRYTNSAGAGTFTTTAPNTPGTYEFRYLTAGSFTDVARSGPLAVAVGGPTIVLTASPASIGQGQSARLSWSTTNATTCSASGGWAGTRPAAGLEDVSPSVTTSYTLTCAGPTGSASRAMSLIVESGTGGQAFYVATNGNDNSPGTEAAPFKTLKKALSVLKAGNTLLVRGGEYDTAEGVSGALSDGGSSIIPSGESWTKPVTIKAYSGEKAVFRRFLPQGYGSTEEEVRNAIHLPTYQECAVYASYGLISNWPYSCWQGSGNNQPAGGLFWQAPKGFLSGYVVDMLNIRVPVQYVIFDGIDIDAKGIVPNPIGFSDYSKHIRFQNLEIRYGIGSCIAQVANDSKTDMDLQFINTKIHSCGVPFDTNMVGNVLARKTIWARYWHGWYLHAGGASFINSESYNHAGTGMTPDGNNIVIRNSKIYDNSGQGLYITGGDNWIVENNLFYNNAYYEVYNYGGQHHTIRNNTIIAGPRNNYATSGVSSAGIYLHEGSSGSVHENNIIDGFRYGVYNQSTRWEPNIVRNNLMRTAPAGSEMFSIGTNPVAASSNTLNRDPLFVNPAAGDYRLQPGSPAIGAATDGGNLGIR